MEHISSGQEWTSSPNASGHQRKGGPSWKDVEARVTLDASTGHVIKIEAARNITRECEHPLLPGGPCDIVTLLIWSNPTIESGLRLRI